MKLSINTLISDKLKRHLEDKVAYIIHVIEIEIVQIIIIYYSDVILSAMESQITGVSIVYSSFRSGADQRKHQSSASLTRKMVSFDDITLG